MAKTSSRFRVPNKASFCGSDSGSVSAKRFWRTNDKISSKILLQIKPIDYHDRRSFYNEKLSLPEPSLVRESVDEAKVLHTYPIKVNICTPLPSPKKFNPSNHMTHRAIKNVLQSETTVKSWWHESEVPNGRDQRLSFLGSQRFVPIKKYKKRFASPIKNKRKPLGPG